MPCRGERAREVDDGDLLEMHIDQPAFADAVLAVPTQLLDAVVPLRSGGKNFGHEIRRAPHLVANDRQPLRGDEDHVGLENERRRFVEDDVDRRDSDTTEPARFDVIAPDLRDPEHERLMREKRRRRLAQDSDGELAAPGRFVRVVQILARRHGTVLSTTIASSA